MYIVSYTYTRTIGGKIFNNRRAVEELDVENGTEGMQCSCSSSEYKYDLCGHVLTGDLSIIRDVKLRNLIRKGPVFREQNNIDWEVNLKNCKASVSKYVKKWARDWEETVHECIEQRVRCLKQRHVNRRKKHVLKNRVHLDYLNKLHENYVLVPADKAANNVIVVCKKYYLDVVLKELESTNTYQEVHSDCSSVVSRHLKYMVQMTSLYRNNKNICHHFTGYQSCIRTLMVPGSSLLQINVLPNSFHRYLLLVLKPYLYIINNTVQEFIRILELIAFGS